MEDSVIHDGGTLDMEARLCCGVCDKDLSDATNVVVLFRSSNPNQVVCRACLDDMD